MGEEKEIISHWVLEYLARELFEVFHKDDVDNRIKQCNWIQKIVKEANLLLCIDSRGFPHDFEQQRCWLLIQLMSKLVASGSGQENAVMSTSSSDCSTIPLTPLEEAVDVFDKLLRIPKFVFSLPPLAEQMIRHMKSSIKEQAVFEACRRGDHNLALKVFSRLWPRKRDQHNILGEDDDGVQKCCLALIKNRPASAESQTLLNLVPSFDSFLMESRKFLSLIFDATEPPFLTKAAKLVYRNSLNTSQHFEGPVHGSSGKKTDDDILESTAISERNEPCASGNKDSDDTRDPGSVESDNLADCIPRNLETVRRFLKDAGMPGNKNNDLVAMDTSDGGELESDTELTDAEPQAKDVVTKKLSFDKTEETVQCSVAADNQLSSCSGNRLNAAIQLQLAGSAVVRVKNDGKSSLNFFSAYFEHTEAQKSIMRDIEKRGTEGNCVVSEMSDNDKTTVPSWKKEAGILPEMDDGSRAAGIDNTSAIELSFRKPTRNISLHVASSKHSEVRQQATKTIVVSSSSGNGQTPSKRDGRVSDNRTSQERTRSLEKPSSSFHSNNAGGHAESSCRSEKINHSSAAVDTSDEKDNENYDDISRGGKLKRDSKHKNSASPLKVAAARRKRLILSDDEEENGKDKDDPFELFSVLEPKKKGRREWTKLEEEKVYRGIQKYGLAWTLIARDLPGRTNVNIKDKWRTMQNQKRVAELAVVFGPIDFK